MQSRSPQSSGKAPPKASGGNRLPAKRGGCVHDDAIWALLQQESLTRMEASHASDRQKTDSKISSPGGRTIGRRRRRPVPDDEQKRPRKFQKSVLRPEPRDVDELGSMWEGP